MKNEYIVSDFEIVENKYFGINTGKLINDFLELFSSDPDNMSNSKYVNKLNTMQESSYVTIIKYLYFYARINLIAT